MGPAVVVKWFQASVFNRRLRVGFGFLAHTNSLMTCKVSLDSFRGFLGNQDISIMGEGGGVVVVVGGVVVVVGGVVVVVGGSVVVVVGGNMVVVVGGNVVVVVGGSVVVVVGGSVVVVVGGSVLVFVGGNVMVVVGGNVVVVDRSSVVLKCSQLICTSSGGMVGLGGGVVWRLESLKESAVGFFVVVASGVVLKFFHLILIAGGFVVVGFDVVWKFFQPKPT